jgi:hypothetical protein
MVAAGAPSGSTLSAAEEWILRRRSLSAAERLCGERSLSTLTTWEDDMARRVVSNASVTNLGPIEMVREGMKVVDSNGKDVGKVEAVKMGDPGAATEEGNELQDTGFLGDVAEAIGGDEREPDVPGPMRAPLLRSGYVKVDGGFFFGTDRYVTPEQIASVDKDTVHLREMKDHLVKED